VLSDSASSRGDLAILQFSIVVTRRAMRAAYERVSVLFFGAILTVMDNEGMDWAWCRVVKFVEVSKRERLEKKFEFVCVWAPRLLPPCD
jgi:hypothetical protein